MWGGGQALTIVSVSVAVHMHFYNIICLFSPPLSCCLQMVSK